MNIAKNESADRVKLHINHINCRLQVSTPSGPARMAIIDSNGNILPIDNVDDLLADAAIEALMDTIAPSLPEFTRRLDPPKPLW